MIALFAFVSASAPDDNICRFTESDSAKLTEIIREGDSLQKISALLGEVCPFQPNIKLPFGESYHLLEMIEHNRVESFKILFPLMQFSSNYWKEGLLREALLNKRFAICDFLMWQPFLIGDTFEMVWRGPWRWNGKLLAKLARTHHHRILEMVPKAYLLDIMDDTATVLNAVKFIIYCSRLNQRFAAIPEYQPFALLSLVSRNSALSDAQMVEIFNLLLSEKATVDQATLSEFKRINPNYVESYNALASAVRY